MRATIKLTSPETVLVSATLTMSLSDWERLRTQLEQTERPNAHPGWKLRGVINSLVQKVLKEFTEEVIYE